MIVVGLWVVALGTATCLRNQVWRSPLTLWEDASRKSPRKARVWHSLGNAYYFSRQLALAEIAYRNAIDADPKNTPSFNNLATLLHDQGRYQDAVETGLRGLAAGPSIYDHLLYFSLGRSYRNSGDTANSLVAFMNALKLAPAHRPTHLEIGWLYCQTGPYNAALHHLRTAAKLEPPDQRLTNLIEEVEVAIRSQQANR